MGRRRNKGRDINGIVLLDKPLGWTSNKALQVVKRLFNAKKAGHTGNLDPLATGVLPICLGEATKMSAFLLDADKRYRGTVKLGVRTTSGDAEGDVLETRSVPSLSEQQVLQVLEQFVGEIQQIPPMHSALKHKGQPLYKLARQGIEVEREPRTVVIHELNLLKMTDDELDIDVHCSKGTYIRTLAEDIGEALGCGAHLSSLCRTKAGPFLLENAVTLATLDALAEQGLDSLDTVIHPMEKALADWPELNLSENAAYYLQQGQPVIVPRAPTMGWVRLYVGEGRFLGVGAILDDGRVAPKRLLKTG